MHCVSTNPSREMSQSLIAPGVGALICLLSGGLVGGQAVPVPAAGAIIVAVADSVRAPIAGADIQVDGGRWRGVTDDGGRLRFESVPAGTHRVVARRLGLAPESLSTTVSPGQASEVRFSFVPPP